jgi:chemotaxis protein methyltransferase CheR
MPEREFHFTQADFERIRKLIHQQAGISLAPIKQDMVYSRLARRLRALGLATFAEYLSLLETGDPQEWETFVNSLTTNLTSFFREAHHFDILRKHLQAAHHRPLRIWCSAASTGEEPYSLAITACETFDTLSPSVEILASDIDTNVLATAQRGVYPMERVERLSAERLQRFFLKGSGAQVGYARVRPELQRLITFTRINLLDPRWPVRESLDVIFCRNVMIYFDKPTQEAVINKLCRNLVPGGYLFVGHSESLAGLNLPVACIGPAIYRKPL